MESENDPLFSSPSGVHRVFGLNVLTSLSIQSFYRLKIAAGCPDSVGKDSPVKAASWR